MQGLYLNGEFRKYGDILSAEFVNNGMTHRAYRFEYDGKIDYYDENGKSLRKAFLKAPLSFRRISSRFSNGRFHPILKIYRPHHGLDYTAFGRLKNQMDSRLASITPSVFAFDGKRKYDSL